MLNPTPALLRGREHAESLMVDACTITRVTGQSTDDLTGDVVDVTSTLYTGKCRFQQAAGAHARTEDVAEDYLRLLRIEVQLPMSVIGLRTTDIVLATASLLDPDLIGRIFRIRDLAHKTHMTARRVRVEEIT